MPGPSSTGESTAGGNPVGEAIDLVKTYARQQALDPVKGAARWIAWGAAGAVFLSFGLVLLTLALLRWLQGHFHGNATIWPYAITVATCAVLAAVALSRIRKTSLARKEPRP
jgi:Putative Actinobacterial Holin-X, holin superfamily III